MNGIRTVTGLCLFFGNMQHFTVINFQFQKQDTWSCGLIHHVLDWEVRGLNLGLKTYDWVTSETTVWKQTIV